MATDHHSELAKIHRFDQLIKYLRDEMGWPISQDSFDDDDDLFYDFTTEELGIDMKNAAKIARILQLNLRFSLLLNIIGSFPIKDGRLAVLINFF